MFFYAADKLVADTLSIIEIMELCICDQTSHIEFIVISLKRMLKSLTEDKMNLQIQSVQKSCICLQKYKQCTIEMNIGLKVT